MARRRRGQVSRQSSLSIGDSVNAGRNFSVASRRYLLPRLPRPNAVAINDAFQSRRQAITRRLFPKLNIALPKVEQVRRRVATLRLFSRRPLIPMKTSPCRRRVVRKEVMFSRGVAGRKWRGSGGPQMKRARRTVESFYTCR